MLHGWPFGVLGWLPLAVGHGSSLCVGWPSYMCMLRLHASVNGADSTPKMVREHPPPPPPSPPPPRIGARAPLPLPRGGKRLLSGFHTSALAPFRPLGSGAQRNPNRGGITTQSPCHLPGKSGSSPQSTGARSLRTLLASSAHRGPPPLGPLSPDPRFFFR